MFVRLRRKGVDNMTTAIAAGDGITDFRSLVENLPANIVRYDRNCRVIYASPQFERNTGMQRTGMLGKKWSEIALGNEAEAAILESLIGNILSTGTPAEIDLSISTPNGPQVHHVRMVAEREDNGQIIGVLAVGMDISERRKIESRLQLLSFAMDQVSEAALLLDQDARIIYANKGAGTMLGYDPDKLSRMTLAQLRHDHDPLHWAAHWQQLRDHGSMVYEVINRGSDGCEIQIEVNATYFEVDGQGYDLALGRDISARKQLEAAREAALLEAERLARTKTEFLANMSHEIRTPLNAVLSMAQLGMRINSSDKVHKQFTSILDAGQLLLSLLNDILDYSKIDAGKLSLEMGRVDPHILIDSVVELSAARAWDKGLNFRIEEAADLPLSFPGDPLRLAQVLVNLLSNAIKFTDSGSVALKVEHSHSSLLFTVSDTGIGMNTEQIDRLFIPFEQADGSTTRRYGGSGLGLAISKRLTDLMGGRITPNGLPGRGMTFKVEIPVPDMQVEPRPVQVGQIGLSGPSCALELVDELPNWGIEVMLCSLRETLITDASPQLLVLPYAAVTQTDFAQLAQQALDRGRRLAVVLPPGGLPDIPQDLAERIEFLDWPPRSRHIHRLLGDHRPRHNPLPESSTPRLQGIRILAAEDNELNRVILEELLILEGASVESVENGRLLLERLRQGPSDFDIILTDVQMPDMDGYEATRHIRAIAPRLPIIGLTAHVLGDERERCLASGMSAHVGKPAHLNSLVQVILELSGRETDISSATSGSQRVEVSPAADTATNPTVEHDRVVDWQTLESNYQGKRELVMRGCRLLLDKHHAAPTRLRELAASSNFTELAILAHNLKGMAGNLQAARVWQQAVQLEQMLEQTPAESIRQTEALAQEVENLLKEVAQHLEAVATG